jgi:restriction endonuclease, S subunit
MKCELKRQKLIEFADIQTGPFGSQLHKENYVDNGTPIVTVEHLGKRRFTEQNLPKVSDEDKKRLNKYMLRKGDIVFSRVGSVDRCSYVDTFHDGWMFSGRCLRVRPSSDVLPLYLYYFFCLEDTKEFIRNIAVGATMPSINTKLMGEVEVTFPSIEIQQKVVEILSFLDDKIELNNKINENLQQQSAALFRSWFVDCVPFGGTAPDEWKNVTLEEITALVSRGIAPKYADNTDQIVINQKCIRNHMIDLSLARNNRSKVINDKWLQFGDLLINSTGDGTLGRAAQVWFQPHNLTVDSHVTIVRPAAKNMIFYIGLWGILHEKEIESLHTGSTGQTELPRDRVKALELLLPDKETLERFNALIAPMAAAIFRNSLKC